jgi:hypothetical protein
MLLFFNCSSFIEWIIRPKVDSKTPAKVELVSVVLLPTTLTKLDNNRIGPEKMMDCGEFRCWLGRGRYEWMRTRRGIAPSGDETHTHPLSVECHPGRKKQGKIYCRSPCVCPPHVEDTISCEHVNAHHQQEDLDFTTHNDLTVNKPPSCRSNIVYNTVFVLSC